jgi:MoaA/NifB/PqqE/SkfB family radical SAM enzyme
VTPAEVRSIELGITNKCTLRCPHCDSITMGMPAQPPVNLDLDVLITFMDQLPSLESVLLEGAYSDQLMYPRLLEVVAYCKQRSLKIRFCTHGSARTDSWWQQLGALLTPDDIVRFCVDGSTQELHSTYRVNSTLSVVLSNHATLKASTAATTSLQHIVFQYNEHDTDNVIALSEQLGFDYCEIIHCGNITPTADTTRDKIIPVARLARQYAMNNKIIHTLSRDKYTCDSVLRAEVYLNHRGELTMCADHDDGTIKPTIYDTNIHEIFSHMTNTTDKRRCFKFCNQLDYNIGKTFPTLTYGRKEQIVSFHNRELP